MAKSFHQLLVSLLRGSLFAEAIPSMVEETAGLQGRASRSDVRLLIWIAILFFATSCASQADATPQHLPTLAGSLQPYKTPSPSAVPLTATPIPTRTPLPTPTPNIYVVQSGETMGSIALDFGLDMGDLVNANPEVSPYAMSIGQELIIPDKEAQTVVTAVEPLPIPFTDPNCYTTLSGGMWCFVLAQNNTESMVAGISFDVQVYDGTGALIANKTAFPLLDRLPAGESMPAVVYFESAPTEYQVYAELLTAFEAGGQDENCLPATLTGVLTKIAWDGKSAQVSGQVLFDGDAEQIWVLATAFDAADQVVGVRRWDSDAGGRSFEITVASLEPEIARVALSVEVMRTNKTFQE